MDVSNLRRFLKPKLASLFISRSINSSESILVNVFQNFVHVALKMHAYVRELKRDGLADIRGPVLVKAIHSSISFASQMVFKHTTSINVSWLGYRAFVIVLSGKPSMYRGYVLDRLETYMKKHETEEDRQYESLLKDAANELILNIM